MQTFFGVENLY